MINQTEALTSIDVNSGRSKDIQSIDETANRINLEAAHHIIQQIKLRNISGFNSNRFHRYAFTRQSRHN